MCKSHYCNKQPDTITTASVTPTVTIAADQNPVCNGTTVTFTATPINGGTTPIYQWQVNGVNAGTNSETFTVHHTCRWRYSNSDHDKQCKLRDHTDSNECSCYNDDHNCNTGGNITSPTNSICAGRSITFTATPTNGGATPAYQWMVNGNPVAGETAATFTTTTFK